MKSKNDFESEKEYKDYLRTYFAAQAMQGLISTINVYEYVDLANYSVRAADATLERLERIKK